MRVSAGCLAMHLSLGTVNFRFLVTTQKSELTSQMQLYQIMANFIGQFGSLSLCDGTSNLKSAVIYIKLATRSDKVSTNNVYNNMCQQQNRLGLHCQNVGASMPDNWVPTLVYKNMLLQSLMRMVCEHLVVFTSVSASCLL